MAKYEVNFTAPAFTYVTVEADNSDDAVEKAFGILDATVPSSMRPLGAQEPIDLGDFECLSVCDEDGNPVF